MPLMQNWTEITVDDDLLVPVLKELLALAIDPNHVEVSNGASGRVILVDVDLAEIWYQHMLKKAGSEEGEALDPAPEPLPTDIVAELEVAPATIDVPTEPEATAVTGEKVAPAAIEDEVVASAEAPAPAVIATASGSSIVAAASNKDDDAATTSQGTEDLVPLPVKRGPGRPRKQTAPSASNGEDL